MSTIWQKIVDWFQSKGGFAHVVAGLFAAAIAAYAVVPDFKNLVFHVYSLTPSWFHEVALAAIGLWTWYKNTSAKEGA